MNKYLLIVGLMTFSAPQPCAQAQDIQFNNYHTQDQINQFMRDEATNHPTLVHFQILGKSEQGREISYVTIGKKSNTPALYYNGTHHGDEWSSTESILGLIDYLVNHANDPTIDGLLNAYTFYILPLVNPDGHFAQNRMDPHGRDPNRDYSWPGKSDADSFKIPPIQLQKQLLDQIKPRAAAAYHSGIEEVLWSWCYTDQKIPDADLFAAITQKTATAMGFDRYLQSYDDYATNGEFIDYAYMKYKTIALTFEVSVIKTPPASDLDGIVKNSVLGAIAFATAVQNADLGLIPLHSGEYERIKRTWTPSSTPIRLE